MAQETTAQFNARLSINRLSRISKCKDVVRKLAMLEAHNMINAQEQARVTICNPAHLKQKRAGL